MNIWQPIDFFFAVLWALLAAATHYVIGLLEALYEQDDTYSDLDMKAYRYGMPVIRGLFYLMVGFSVCTIALPLLDALLDALFGAANHLFDKYGGPAIFVGCIVLWWREEHPKAPAPVPAAVTDVDIELARQAAMDMQGYALNFMLRVLIAISSFTPVIRPRDTYDIARRPTDGASFYMKGDVVIYQAEAEVEGEITPEVEDTIQREAQRYAQKYIADYPMLISPEAGGRAPVEVLGVMNSGKQIVIDYVFTSTKSMEMIDARRRARVERQIKQERPAPYTDPDYGE